MAAWQDVLDYWFRGDEPNNELWWKKNPATDAEIRERFGALVDRAAAGELDDWASDPRGRLALIVSLDQFTRNMHRSSPRAWENDDKALQLTLEGIELGHDRGLGRYEGQFFYMPLMHAESLEHLDACVSNFERLCAEAGLGEQSLHFAHAHRKIIARFGRYPHRNELLGRECTPEEIEFLKEPNSSF